VPSRTRKIRLVSEALGGAQWVADLGNGASAVHPAMHGIVCNRFSFAVTRKTSSFGDGRRPLSNTQRRKSRDASFSCGLPSLAGVGPLQSHSLDNDGPCAFCAQAEQTIHLAAPSVERYGSVCFDMPASPS
jgi:hypothetical protein